MKNHIEGIKVVQQEEQKSTLPKADFNVNDENTSPLTMRLDVAVKQPASAKNDFVVQTHASVLYRCRTKLESIKSNKFDYGELLLSVCAAGIGIIASAYLSGVKLTSDNAVLFYVVTPAATVGCGVAYFIKKNFTHKSSSELAEEILQELPNPDETVEVKAEK